ncbi:TIMELESS-interacting protein isoform X2 [Sphaeramia orbicularis]|uniref:TIMELESS-interacting protein isoform X2 n=1 Tax=Sphaeramia orbicularis TaxID=375764 RepID=UPI00117D7B3A|nr:TIMELESS-interacting protein isoform X2 [Sphaeramia orbicularis]
MEDLPDYSQIEDESFPPLPPPDSPGQGGQDNGDPFANDEDGEVSKLADVPVAKKKGVKRPQPKLDSQRLTSDRGLPALRTLFEDVRFKGKGHEAEDLHLLMQKMENWAHRLYPKLQFEDFIDKVEKLGSKKEVQTCLKRIRLDMPLTHDDFIGKDGEEEVAPEPHIFGDPDPFGNDLPRLVHSTPAPTAPTTPATPSLTEEQRRRMELNRQKALERRLARQQQEQQQQQQMTDSSDNKILDSSLSVDESVAVSSENALNNLETQDDIEDLNLDLVSSSTQQPSQTPATDSETPEETSQTSKKETGKLETSKEEAGKVETSQEEAGKVETSQEEAGKVETSQEEISKLEETSKDKEPVEVEAGKLESSYSPVHHISNDCEDEE